MRAFAMWCMALSLAAFGGFVAYMFSTPDRVELAVAMLTCA